MLHVQVCLLSPERVLHVSQPGTLQHQCRLAIWECANRPGSAPDFLLQSLHGIVRSSPSPVLSGEVHVDQGVKSRSFYIFLGMDGFEHGCYQLDLTSGYYREDCRNAPCSVGPCPMDHFQSRLHLDQDTCLQ